MMTGGSAVPFSFKAELRKGYRHWGKFLGVVLLGGFLVCIASWVFMLPYVVAVNAYFSSIEGQVNFSDTALIPTGGYLAMMLACVAGYTLMMLFAMFGKIATVYAAGCIHAENKEIKK